jgi:hypothetical protein
MMTMTISTWAEPAVAGILFGAILATAVGFTWGGWMTASGSRQFSSSSTAAGVATALLPYCIEKSRNDPAAEKVFEKLKGTSGYLRQRIIEQAGWATPLGTTYPNWDLSALCIEEIVKVYSLSQAAVR